MQKALYRFVAGKDHRVVPFRNGPIHFWHDERTPGVSILYAVRGDNRNHLITLEAEKLEITRAKNGRALSKRIHIHGFPVTEPRVEALVQSLIRAGLMEQMPHTHTPPPNLE